jgi:hypothetical protein
MGVVLAGRNGPGATNPVIDVLFDPAALYSFRRDGFKHRGGRHDRERQLSGDYASLTIGRAP